MIRCAFCGLAETPDPALADWVPSFWHVGPDTLESVEYYGPICPGCVNSLDLAEDGELELPSIQGLPATARRI